MKKKTIIRLFAALTAAALLSACGGSSNGAVAYSSAATYDAVTEAAAEEMYLESGMGGVDTVLEPQETDRKIVYTAYLRLESTDFTAAREALLAAVEQYDAYLQYTDQSGSAKDADRYASYTVRVPVEHYSDFLTAAGEAGSVLNLSESAEDITSSYIDVEARLTALKAQRDRLNDLADKAETTSDLLEIENQLADVQYQIESYTQQMRSMTDRITYSTVDITLREVSTLTPKGVTFLERLNDAFNGGIDAFVAFVQELVLGIVYNLPMLVVLAILIPLFLKLRRVWRAKHPKKVKPVRSRRAVPPTYDAPAAEATAAEPQPDEEPKPKY